MFNGQLQCEACVARFKVALEQEVKKSDQEDQMSSNEACNARSEAPFELGAKDFKCARRVQDEDRRECQTPEGRKEEDIVEGQPSSYP